MKMEQLAQRLHDHDSPRWKRRVRVRFFLEFDAILRFIGFFRLPFMSNTIDAFDSMTANEYKCDYSGNKGDHYVRTFRLDF